MNRFVHATLRHFMQSPITEISDGHGGNGGSNIDGSADDDSSDDEPDLDTEDDDESEEEELSLIIDGEKPEETDDDADEEGKPAPKWVKEVRKDNREKARRIRELEAQVSKLATPQKAAAPVLGKKPSMEDADIDWDAEKFEEALTNWHEKKRQIDQHEADQKKAQEQQEEEWKGRQSAYATGKTALKFKDVADAEEIACSFLDVTQQGIILQGAENSALLVYALGKNPKKAAELGAIKDAVKFAFAVAKLETKLKTESKKPNKPPAPETEVRGQGRITGSTDSTLEKLREEAHRTGNTDKLMAYKRAQKKKLQK